MNTPPAPHAPPAPTVPKLAPKAKAKGAAPPPPSPVLQVDAGIFRRMASTVLHAVSTDTDRGHLSSLHIVATEERLMMEGTDGHLLARWVTDGSFSPLDTLVPRDRIALFLGDLPKPTKQADLFDDGKITIGPTFLDGSGVRVTYKAPENAFPSASDIIPPLERLAHRKPFGIAGAYLEILGKMLDGLKLSFVEFHLGSETTQVLRVVVPTIPELVLVLAPVRTDVDDAS